MPTVKTPHPKTVSDCRISPRGNRGELTAYDHVCKEGNNQYLAIHFGNPNTTWWNTNGG